MPHTSSSSIYRVIILQGCSTTEEEKVKGRISKEGVKKKVNYAKPQSQFDCYNNLIWGVDLTEANLFWHLLWGICGFAHRKLPTYSKEESCVFILLKKMCGFWKWTQGRDGLPGLPSHEALIIWGVKSFRHHSNLQMEQVSQKGKVTASINLSKWWEDNFKGRQRESLWFLLGQPES